MGKRFNECLPTLLRQSLIESYPNFSCKMTPYVVFSSGIARQLKRLVRRLLFKLSPFLLTVGSAFFGGGARTSPSSTTLHPLVPPVRGLFLSKFVDTIGIEALSMTEGVYG